MNGKKILLIGAATVLGGLSLACGSDTDNDSGGTTKDKPISTSTTGHAKKTPKKDDANTISGDGTFAVGSQIKPGTYRTVVPKDSLDCYWERLKDASGDFDSIIANDNGDPGSQQIVKIKSSDKFFKTQGCGTWTKIK